MYHSWSLIHMYICAMLWPSAVHSDWPEQLHLHTLEMLYQQMLPPPLDVAMPPTLGEFLRFQSRFSPLDNNRHIRLHLWKNLPTIWACWVSHTWSGCVWMARAFHFFLLSRLKLLLLLSICALVFKLKPKHIKWVFVISLAGSFIVCAGCFFAAAVCSLPTEK